MTINNYGVSLLNCLTGATMFLKCAHPAIDGERHREIMWLKDGSAEHQVLQAVANDKKLLTDMDKLSEFRHTGGLENLHSLLLKWAPKRIHFFYAGMRPAFRLQACTTITMLEDSRQALKPVAFVTHWFSQRQRGSG